MDKFGSRRRAASRSMLQDLEMNDHRITGLGDPKDDADAATKHWVNQEMKDVLKGFEELRAEYDQLKVVGRRTATEINDSIKAAVRDKVDRTECVSTNGGKMGTDLDMQGHAIRNLPEGAHADEPVTKGWYAKNWQDLAASMQARIDALEEKLRKSGRSKRDLETISAMQGRIDIVDQTIESYRESARVAIEALEEKINSHHGYGRIDRG